VLEESMEILELLDAPTTSNWRARPRSGRGEQIQREHARRNVATNGSVASLRQKIHAGTSTPREERRATDLEQRARPELELREDRGSERASAYPPTPTASEASTSASTDDRR
jgi:hypothetical protein